MFRIEPTAPYSLEELERELGKAISVQAFLDSYKPIKRSKGLWWGEDLIEAIRNKKPINDADVPDVPQVHQNPRTCARFCFLPVPCAIRHVRPSTCERMCECSARAVGQTPDGEEA